jgi:hypothetical protein
MEMMRMMNGTSRGRWRGNEMHTLWWRSNPIQNFWVWLRVQLRVQDHLGFKLMYRMHTKSDLNVLHMQINLGVVHIKIDSQVAYDMQLDLVPCPNSSEINGNHRNNLTSKIYPSVAPLFLAFGLCIMSSPSGLHPGDTCTSLFLLYSVAAIEISQVFHRLVC